MRTARWAAVILVGIGVLAYSAWLLEFVLSTGLSPLHDPAWRLLTAEPVFRTAHLVAGIAFLFGGPPMIRLAPVHWTGRLSAGAITVFGAIVLAETAFPGNVVIEVLTNLAFVAGCVGVVLWWPSRWRTFAAIGLGLVLVTWLGVVVLGQFGPDHFLGLLTRIQLLIRAILLAAGVAYVLRFTPGGSHS
ncbi:hypothetical protein [Amycolatopsis sp. H20-H5]|uniref:hypothetical protein n=1 Tax=Amycolatopsis sp. H20-H5 TaxID=3046309 RepID=UPI002DBAB7D1|nr:hypothetical protein [Amycolatopsis sp. H20-H5]MEC3980630.1 hypothetical protein [Amycolatopsis sp. H20-H5]